jgi:CubicO group peptidase (beta-lactamase class C family)
MLMQLLERHQVHLADPVERYLPEVRRVRGSGAGSAGVTLVQLATMTSGLARDPNDGRRSQTGLPEHWMLTLMAALPKTEYTGQPGAGYRYSNIGYAILGAALARAAKVAYLDYQRRYILRPLGMSSTDFQLTPALHQRLATGVDYDELYRDTLNYGDASREVREGLGFRVPSGGLYSTVGDLAKLVSMELGFGPQGAAPENSDASRRCAGCRLSESGLRVWAWLSGASMGRHGCNGTFRQPGRLHVDAALRQRARVWGHRAAPRGGWQSRRRPASRSGFP